MKLFILKNISSLKFYEFVNFWQPFYSYDKKLYNKNINKKYFTKKDILNLYTWKNGKELNSKVKISINKNIIASLKNINNYKKCKNINTKKILMEFSKIKGTVWKIFLLHIIKPKEFPIYDQNVHRAYAFIHSHKWERINNKISQKEKENFYFNEYLKFIKEHKYLVLKSIDEALFAFGKFIKTKHYKKFFNK